MRHKRLLETKVVFRYFSYKNSDDNKKICCTIGPNISQERYHNHFLCVFH